MAVAHDADGTEVAAANVTSVSLGTLTIGAISNGALVAWLVFGNTSGVSAITVKWDTAGTNQSMTSIVNAASPTALHQATAVLFGLVNPTQGNKNGTASWTGNADVYFQLASFSGVDQTGGSTTFRNSNSNSGTGTAASVAITSATGELAVDCVGNGDTTNSTGSPTKTQVWNDNSAAASSGGGSRAAGAATVNFGWTISPGPTCNWVDVGCSIKAAAAGFTPKFRRTLSGVGSRVGARQLHG